MSDRLIAWLKTQPVVVLSPHFDDACLSLGAILHALRSATLVNIFTRSVWLRKSAVANPTEDYVRSIRDAEDRAFAEYCGLIRYDLHCCEPAIVGRKPLDPSHVEDDIAQAEAPVLEKLDALAPRIGRSFLIVPLGVGLHVNHRATVEVVLRNLDRIASRYDVLFYEDQPYAAQLFQRLAALRRIKKRLNGNALKRHVFIPPWAEKKALIAFYPSQFPEPNARRRFRPASLWPLAPHEALWSRA